MVSRVRAGNQTPNPTGRIMARPGNETLLLTDWFLWHLVRGVLQGLGLLRVA